MTRAALKEFFSAFRDPRSRTRRIATSSIFVLISVMLVHAAFLSAAYRDAHGAYSLDYRYYLEFSQRAFEPDAHFSDDVVIRHGMNFLLKGPDGASGLHRGVHFEPVKYVAAAVYALFGTAASIGAFYILVFFAPLLYIAWIAWRGGARRILIIAGCLYAFAPAVVYVPTDDLRPFIAFFPACFAFFISLIERRPLHEQLLFLNALAATREEGILYAALGLVYLFMSRTMGDAREGKRLRILSVNLALWAGICAAYFAWIFPSYQWQDFRLVIQIAAWWLQAWWPAAAGIVALIVAAAWRWRRFLRAHRAEAFLSLCFLIPLIATPALGFIRPLLNAQILIFGRYGMLFALSAAIALMAWFRRWRMV